MLANRFRVVQVVVDHLRLDVLVSIEVQRNGPQTWLEERVDLLIPHSRNAVSMDAFREPHQLARLLVALLFLALVCLHHDSTQQSNNQLQNYQSITNQLNYLPDGGFAGMLI